MSNPSGSRRGSVLSQGGGRRTLHQVRRNSVFFNRRQSINPSTNESEAGVVRPRQPQTENTYKMTPDEGSAFNVCNVERIIERVLTTNLKSHQYDQFATPKMALVLSGLLKNDCKRLNMKRYKLIAQVLICEDRSQAAQVVSRSLWEDSMDNFASYVYSNDHISAIGLVHGLYYD